jgi:hypothetical protein
MWTIRSEQSRALGEVTRRRFEDHCLELVQRSWGDLYASWGEDALRGELRELFTAGHDWGFKSERDLYRLVNVACLLGLGFQRANAPAWAVRVLGATRRPIEARIDAVIARLERQELLK